MQHFLALLDEKRAAQVSARIELLRLARAAGTIRNKDFQDTKFVLNNALEVAKRTFLDRQGRNWSPGSIESDFYYWLPYVHTASGWMRKLIPHDNRPFVAEALLWLREVAEVAALMEELKPMIVKGRKPSENPVVRDLTNTGTCAICGDNHKLDKNGKVVLHGYIRPGDGVTHGECFGRSYLPYELSCEANKALAPILERRLENQQKWHERLVKDEVGQFEVTRRKHGGRIGERELVTIARTSPDFQHIRQSKINEAKHEISMLSTQQNLNNVRIANWTMAPRWPDGTPIE